MMLQHPSLSWLVHPPTLFVCFLRICAFFSLLFSAASINNGFSGQDAQMANIPVDAIYGSYLGVMFSSRTRFLVKQLVRESNIMTTHELY